MSAIGSARFRQNKSATASRFLRVRPGYIFGHPQLDPIASGRLNSAPYGHRQFQIASWFKNEVPYLVGTYDLAAIIRTFRRHSRRSRNDLPMARLAVRLLSDVFKAASAGTAHVLPHRISR